MVIYGEVNRWDEGAEDYIWQKSADEEEVKGKWVGAKAGLTIKLCVA